MRKSGKKGENKKEIETYGANRNFRRKKEYGNPTTRHKITDTRYMV